MKVMFSISKLLQSIVTLFILIESVSSSTDWLIKQSHLIKTGFTNILWEYIGSSDFQADANVTSECRLSLNHVNQSLSEGKIWPIKLIESSSRLPDDLSGTGYADFGDYDKCLQSTWTNYNGKNQIASYCLTSLLPNNQNYRENVFTDQKIIGPDHGFNFQIAFCLPSDCSSNDLKIILTNALQPYDWNLIRVEHCTVYSTITEKLTQSSLFEQICFLSIITLVAIIIIANLREYNLINNQKSSSNWLKHFSFKSSYQQIVQPNWSSNKMINLLQYSTMLHSIVIATHVYTWPYVAQAFTLVSIPWGSIPVMDSSMIFQATTASWYYEGIFVYGGYARTLEAWKRVGPTTTLTQVLKTTLTKLLSLSALFTIILVFHVSLPLISTGPLQMATTASDGCLGSVWSTILLNNNHIQNYKEACLPHLWSVSVECQCLLVIVLLVFLYKRSPKIGLTCNLIVIVGSLYYVGWLYYNYQFPMNMIIRGLLNVEDSQLYFKDVYLSSWTHLWLYSATVLYVYLTVNDYGATFTKLPILKQLNSNMILFGGFMTIAHMLYPSLVLPYEGPLVLAVYAVVQRLVLFVFFLLVSFRIADETQRFVSDGQVNNSNNNTVDSNGNHLEIKDSDEKLKEMKKYKFYSAIATILRSTFCIHIVMLNLSLDLLRKPFTTRYEYLIFCIFQYIFCILGGILFHFAVLGPFSSIVLSMKKKVKSQ